MIIVSGVMTFKPSSHERAIELARILANETLKEPGCITYGFWAHTEVPGTFRVFEEWATQEALAQHFSTTHFSAFGREFGDGELISMDVHRYIDPEVAGLF